MSAIENAFFSPLGKEYCTFFYALTVVAFLFLLTGVVTAVFAVVKGKLNIFAAAMALVGPFILYFNNRLLYSICVK